MKRWLWLVKGTYFSRYRTYSRSIDNISVDMILFNRDFTIFNNFNNYISSILFLRKAQTEKKVVLTASDGEFFDVLRMRRWDGRETYFIHIILCLFYLYCFMFLLNIHLFICALTYLYFSFFSSMNWFTRLFVNP